MAGLPQIRVVQGLHKEMEKRPQLVPQDVSIAEPATCRGGACGAKAGGQRFKDQRQSSMTPFESVETSL